MDRDGTKPLAELNYVSGEADKIQYRRLLGTKGDARWRHRQQSFASDGQIVTTAVHDGLAVSSD